MEAKAQNRCGTDKVRQERNCTGCFALARAYRRSAFSLESGTHVVRLALRKVQTVVAMIRRPSLGNRLSSVKACMRIFTQAV